MTTRRKNAASPDAESVIENGAQAAQEWRMPVGVGGANGGIVAPNEERDEQGDIEESIGDRIRDLVAQSGADRVRIKVYRRDPRKAQLEWCEDYLPGAFTDDGLAMLRDDWGPGEYEIRVIGSTGVLAKPRVTIAPARNVAQNPATNVNSENTQLLRMMAEQNARILEALTHKPDPMAQMQPALAMMAAMREAMGMNVAPAPAPAAPSLANSLGEMALTLKMLKEISGEITPKDVDADNPMALAMPILEVVKSAIAQRAQNPQPMQAPFPQLQSAPVPTNQPIRPMAIPPSVAAVPIPTRVHKVADMLNKDQLGALPAEFQQESETQMNANNDTDPTPEQAAQALRDALAKLVTMAKENAPVGEAAEFVADNLPDEIIPMLESPMWFDFLCQIAPDLKPHGAWVRAVKIQAVALLFEDVDGADPGDTNPAA